MAGFCVVMMTLGIFLPMLILFFLIFVTFAVIIIFNYFLESFTLYRMCKNCNYKYPLFAWLPFYNRVILGEFADNKKVGYIIFIGRLFELLLSFILIYFVNSISKDFSIFLSCFVIIISIILYILNVVLVHKIMNKTIPKVADILTVINVLTFGISKAIILFILRNNKNLFKMGVTDNG